MKQITILIISLLSLSMLASGQFSVKGKITEKESGKAIISAKVVLLKNSKIISETISGNDGKFIFKNISPDYYVLKVNHPAFKELSKNLKVENCDLWFDIHLELVIKKTEQDELKPPVLPEVVEDAEVSEVEVTSNVISKKMSLCSGIAPYPGGIRKYAPHPDGFYQNHNTEEYDKINENGFREVKNDPLSTFSVDVDRAAYANIRRFLRQNQMPYKDAVRIEEMINYFHYDYKMPNEEHPFSINSEIHECPWNSEHKLMMFGLQGKEFETENIPAANLVFLLDVSGSMNQSNKLPLLKSAFKILVDKLRTEDRVSIVVYAGAAGLVLESTPGNEKSKIMAALDRLSAGGSTAGGAGIKLAYNIAKQNFIPEGNNRVILATDGDFNVGASSNGEMVRLIEEKRKDNVFLSILGFGMGNYKDSKMEQISNAGNGNYFYIDNILEAKKVFNEELWGTLFTIAKDVKIQIEFNPAKVKAYRLIGYENRILNKEDFNDDTKDAGEIGSGHQVTALYEIIPADSKENVSDIDELEYQKVEEVNSKNLCTFKLRYKEPDEDQSNLIVRRLSERDLETAIGNNFKFASAVAQFGMLLRDSEFKANSSFESVLKMAKEGKGADKSGYRKEFIGLVEIAKTLGN